jgi:PII-like signaling protein
MDTILRPARLTIYVCYSATHHHERLYDVVVRRAREAGLSGATVLRGIEGFGRGGDIHTTRLLDVSDHLPIAITIVDDEGKLRDFLRDNELLDGRLVTLEPIELYGDSPRAPRPTSALPG